MAFRTRPGALSVLLGNGVFVPFVALVQGGVTIGQNISEKGPFFATTISRPFEDQSGTWLSGTSFGLHDLEALMNVALEAKEWIAAHGVKR